jgi:hypothetical protein
MSGSMGQGRAFRQTDRRLDPVQGRRMSCGRTFALDATDVPSASRLERLGVTRNGIRNRTDAGSIDRSARVGSKKQRAGLAWFHGHGTREIQAHGTAC